MKVALGILCIGAVIFLLRVLAALLMEWTRVAHASGRIQVAKSAPLQQRGQLIEMNPEPRENVSAGNGERKAV
jgi:hypothetical protein